MSTGLMSTHVSESGQSKKLRHDQKQIMFKNLFKRRDLDSRKKPTESNNFQTLDVVDGEQTNIETMSPCFSNFDHANIHIRFDKCIRNGLPNQLRHCQPRTMYALFNSQARC